MGAQPDPPTVTILLNEQQSAAERLQQLLPLVYDQLRAAAQNCLRSERPGHTLQATALVHEAYLKLVGPREILWQNRAHFYTAAAEAMRQILLDHAKGRACFKRGGPARREGSAVAFQDLAGLASQEPEEIMRFDEVFRRLEAESPDGAAIVRLRLYAGLSVEQTAEALGVSTSTVDRRWAFARAWLYRRLQEGG